MEGSILRLQDCGKREIMVMKKIFFLFAGAIASFLILAHIDQYENLILPLIAKPEGLFARSSDRVNNDVLKVIREFNAFLASAYLASDPSSLTLLPIDERLRSSIAEEINYLTREGKVMDLKIKDIEIEKIERLSPNLIRATTRETVGLRYLSLPKRNEEVAYQETQYNMAYTLVKTDKNWKITNYETRSIK